MKKSLMAHAVRLRKMPVKKRARTPEVRGAVTAYIRAASALTEMNLRVLEYFIGGPDNECLVAFQDKLTHKPVVVDFFDLDAEEDK